MCLQSLWIRINSLIAEGVEGKGGRVRMRKRWRGETNLAMNGM